MRDARAKGGGEHLPLERTQGANSLGGAPNSFFPQGASACLGGGVQLIGRVPTYNNGSNSNLDSNRKRAMPVEATEARQVQNHVIFLEKLVTRTAAERRKVPLK